MYLEEIESFCSMLHSKQVWYILKENSYLYILIMEFWTLIQINRSTFSQIYPNFYEASDLRDTLLSSRVLFFTLLCFSTGKVKVTDICMQRGKVERAGSPRRTRQRW